MTRRLAVIAVAALALAGCAKNTPSATPSAETSLGASATPTASPTGKPPTPKASVTTAPAGPHIVYFRIKTKPSCPSSGPATSFPGNPIELEWKVAGGPTNVTISIDGPGIFGTYTVEHTEKLPFSCSGASGTTQKHTYLLRTVGGGPVVQQTITGEARVN